MVNSDSDDFTVIKFGDSNMLRGKLGRYLCAFQEEMITTQPAAGGGNTGGKSVTFSLSVQGQGVGELWDNLSFVNLDNKDDNGQVRYGMTVGVKSTASKER